MASQGRRNIHEDVRQDVVKYMTSVVTNLHAHGYSVALLTARARGIVKSGETNSPETMSVCAGIDNRIQSEIGITFTRLLSGWQSCTKVTDSVQESLHNRIKSEPTSDSNHSATDSSNNRTLDIPIDHEIEMSSEALYGSLDRLSSKTHNVSSTIPPCEGAVNTAASVSVSVKTEPHDGVYLDNIPSYEETLIAAEYGSPSVLLQRKSDASDSSTAATRTSKLTPVSKNVILSERKTSTSSSKAIQRVHKNSRKTNQQKSKLSNKNSKSKLKNKHKQKYKRRAVAMPYQCEKCEFGCRERSRMMTHQVTHAVDMHEMYSCSECPFMTSKWRDIHTHINYGHIEVIPKTSSSSLNQTSEQQSIGDKTTPQHADDKLDDTEADNTPPDAASEDVCTAADNSKALAVSATSPTGLKDQSHVKSSSDDTADYFIKPRVKFHYKVDQKSGKNMHKCVFCDYVNIRKLLNRHILSHTGERPFKCCLCGYCTRYKAELAVHARVIHKKTLSLQAVNKKIPVTKSVSKPLKDDMIKYYKAKAQLASQPASKKVEIINTGVGRQLEPKPASHNPPRLPFSSIIDEFEYGGIF